MNIGLLCFIAHRAMEARVLAALSGAGFDDLTPAQGRVAARIGPAGTRLTDLAEQAGITKQSTGFLVDQLVKAGYVRRVPDPTDARARLIRLADRGEAAVAVARVAQDAVEGEWAAHLGGDEAETLRSALSRLREITDPYI